MALSVDLGKIKFQWKGDWSAATTYKRDDVVYRSGSAFVCVPVTSVNQDPLTNTTQWNKMAQGSDLGAIANLAAGDLVYYDGADFTRIPAGSSGQSLVLNSSGQPEWAFSKGIVQVVESHGTTGWSRSNSSVYAVPDTEIGITRLTNNPGFMVYGWFRWDDTNSSASGAGIGLQYSLDNSNWTDFFYPALHEDYMGVASDMYSVRDRWWYVPPATAQDVAGSILYFRITQAFNNANAQATAGGTQSTPYWNQQIIVQEVCV